MSKSTHLVLLARLAVWLASAGPQPPSVRGGDDATSRPEARAETERVPSRGNAADDPAIWVHLSDPALSLVLGTDKKGGLHVFDLAGKRVQAISEGSRPDNVDVLYNFPLDGRSVDLAVAGSRSKQAPGVKVWARRVEHSATATCTLTVVYSSLASSQSGLASSALPVASFRIANCALHEISSAPPE